MRSGDLSSVERICDQLIAIDRDHPGARFIGAVCALEAGRPAVAVSGFHTAVSLEPARADYWTQYARCLARLGRQADALASVRRAEALPIDDALTHDTLGNVLTSLGHYAQAVPHFERAVAMQPEQPQYQYNMATSLLFAGKLEQATAAYERVVELDPDHSRAWIALADLAAGPPPADRIERLAAAKERAAGNVDQTLTIAHALARTLEASGDTQRAWDEWTSSKAARKAAIGYTIEEDRRIFSAFRDLFPSAPRAVAAPGDPSAAPIFIIGLPRTGTTLLERMLSAHSAVAAGGETIFMPLAVKQAGRSRHQQLIVTGRLGAALRSDPAAIGRHYLERARAAVGSAARFTDKFPLNFLYVGFIRRAFPNAQIICLRRGALDTCLANFRQMFALDFPYYRYSLSLEDTAEYVAMFEGLVAHWDRVFPDAICHVRYEDLVRNPEDELRRVLTALDLPFEPEMLEFQRNEAPVATASAAQVRRPVHQDSVGAWRRYREALEPVRRRLEALGIDPGIETDQLSDAAG